jgi:antitoxin (DNA-binding transcriptional repressor) of toxin-antitoxin stability system
MYMSESVDITKLRQNLDVYVRRASLGERVVIIDGDGPGAELGPTSTAGGDLDRLIAAGQVSRPTRSALPEPLELAGHPDALSRALDDARADR